MNVGYKSKVSFALAAQMAAVAVGAAQGDQSANLDEHHDHATTVKRQVTNVAKGIYVIRHPDAPDEFPQSNTLVVIGQKSVLVVDSCYLPSAAREDIAQIKTWTKKPIKYLVNTHWHYDHTMGNAEYAKACPGISIIAHRETLNQSVAYNPQWFRNYKIRTDAAGVKAETGLDEKGTKLSDEDRKAQQQQFEARTKVWAEFSQIHDVHPNRTFDTRMKLDLGGRKVELLWLGRGNTLGDAVVYLPRERIVAAGDLADHPVPYLGAGFPMDEPVTLDRLAKMNAKVVVPGHGAVLHDSSFIRLEASFIRAVYHAVADQMRTFGNTSLKFEEVKAAVTKAFPIDAWIKRFGLTDKDDVDFFVSFSFQGVIKASYADVWRR